jgi:hypothetical protein
VGVTSADLSIAQAKKLNKQLGRQLRYLGKLQRRMELRGFPPNDRMYCVTVEAYNALHELCVITHYASCESGVYKDAKIPANVCPDIPNQITAPAASRPK